MLVNMSNEIPYNGACGGGGRDRMLAALMLKPLKIGGEQHFQQEKK